MHRAITRVFVPASLAVGLLGGCTLDSPYTPASGAVVGDNSSRVVQYSNGRYQLYGDGTTSSPYYWVWVPAGTSPPSPPALPPTRVATSSTSDGRYQLYGDGTASSPYYWVWVPTGSTITPPPPPPPRRP